MYAIIKTGGKQYKVSEGETIDIEKLNASEGDTVDFDQVLMVAKDDGVEVGQPLLNNASVTGEVVDCYKGKKVNIIKFKRRKHHMKRMGHRQQHMQVKINSINV